MKENVASSIVCCMLVFASPALAQNQIQKADTSIVEFLNVGSSWVGGQVPGSGDIALFDAAMATETNSMNRIGGDIEVDGIRVVDPAVRNVTSGYSIAASIVSAPVFAYSGTLSIGREGIDLSSAVAPPELSNWFFNIGSPIAVTADQDWHIERSSSQVRWDLSLSGSTFSSTRRTTPTDLGGHTVTKLGDGTVGVLFDRGLSNGTLVIDDGSVEFTNAINATTATNIQLDVDLSLTIKVNDRARLLVSQAPTTGTGGVNWEANMVLEGGYLDLNSGDYTGDLTIGGTMTIPSIRGHITYESESDWPDPIDITIESKLDGGGHLVLFLDGPREQDRVFLAGDDSTLSGLVTLWFGSRVYVTNESGSATGTAVLTTLNGSVLAGDGVLGPVEAEGTIWPGTIDGDTKTLTTGNALITGQLRVDIDGTESDRLVVAGTLELDSPALEMNFPGAGFTEASYIIAEATAITGAGFATVPTGYAVEVVDGGPGQQLVVSAMPDPYLVWLASFQGVDPTLVEPLDDADGDGLSNVVEFVLDENPAAEVRGAATVLALVGGELSYEFTRRKDAKAGGYTSTVQYSIDMNTWTDVVANPVSSDLTTETLVATIPSPARFARLKVTLP